jgi:formylglycine-generating enzyme
MASNANIAGITRSGSSGSYTYSVIGSGDRPITYVSWFDAARFANWLHNGQPTGAQDASTTEDGAYTLNGATSGTAPAKNVGATVWIPTENEWFKAAYYDPTHMSGAGGYWLHANQSNSMTSNNFATAVQRTTMMATMPR